jgi:hypothetical protein
MVNYYFSIICIIIYWIIAAIAFVCFLTAFKGLGLSVSYIQAGGIYIFSWAVGFIALFAPQGIGVSEFISGQLLATDMSTKTLTALLALFRFIVFIGDILTWFLANIISNLKHLRTKSG